MSEICRSCSWSRPNIRCSTCWPNIETNDMIYKLKQELKQLRKDAFELAEFYGKPEHWDHYGRMSDYIFQKQDSDSVVRRTEEGPLSKAGAKARAFLAKYKER